jgi:hypothetical protein
MKFNSIRSFHSTKNSFSPEQDIETTDQMSGNNLQTPTSSSITDMTVARTDKELPPLPTDKTGIPKSSTTNTFKSVRIISFLKKTDIAFDAVMQINTRDSDFEHGTARYAHILFDALFNPSI